MTLDELVTELRQREIHLYLQGGRLRYRGPTGALTPTLRSALQAAREELISRLGGTECRNASGIAPASRSGPLPLSFAQQRLWFLDQLDPGNTIYLMPTALRVTGPLDVQILERSFNELVRRHESLRTTFSVVDGEPVQVIAPEIDLSLPIVDLRDRPEQTEERLRRLATDEARKPFDLSRGPLLRAALSRLPDEEDQPAYLLLMTLHHIISDDWSMALFFKELAAVYEAYCAGRPSPLPPMSLQYADFALWQRRWLQGAALEEQLSYWRRQLDPLPPALSLPTDRPRPAAQTYAGGTHRFRLASEWIRPLQTLSRREGATLFMTLLAAFQVLLHRYGGDRDLYIGTPIANRNRVEIEGIIGFFVNTLVLRTDLSGNPSFVELLKRVRKVCLGAQAHQDLPFERLVEELRPERDMSRNPLFQVMFVLHSVYFEEPRIPGLGIASVQGIRKTAAFDLTLHMAEVGGEMEGWFEYNTDLFEEATLRRMEAHFRNLLSDIVSRPEARIGDLSVLGEAERRRLLTEWNATRTTFRRDISLHGLFQEQVEKTPDAAAVVFEERQITYEEINRRANQLAHLLQRLGTGPEMIVGLCVERSIEMVVGILAILKAGGAYLPIDPSYPKERITFMLEDTQVPLLLTQARLRESLPELQATVICIDSETERISEAVENPKCRAVPENLAYVIYTSGSTGRPKGVAVTHANAVHSTFARIAYYGNAIPRFLLLSSFAFDSSVAGLFGTLCCGGRLILPAEGSQSDLSVLAGIIQRHAVSHLLCIPSLWGLLLEQAGPEALGSLKAVIVAGEPCSIGLAREHRKILPDAAFFNEYGPTEATVWCSVYEVRAEEDHPAIPIGRPIAHTQLYILDEYLQPLPEKVAGEIYVGGAGLARGYLNRSDRTAERFIPDPFGDTPGERLYRTGDRARFLRDGKIEFLGRIDDQVKIRGYRVELGEVEAALGRHPAVAEAAVIAREDAPGAKHLAAYLVPHAGADLDLDLDDLRSFLRRNLADYMIPSAFVVLDSIPRTPNGKTDRKGLPAPRLCDGPAGSYLAPRTETEARLADLWKEVLGLDRVGVRYNFFELGGHSLLAARLLFRIREVFKIDLPLRSLFQNTTVEAQAKRIEEGSLSVPGRDPSTVDLKAEAVLDPAIVPPETAAGIEAGPMAILLTGATGFLGAFLLHELIRQTRARIYCLVRARSLPEASEKIRRTLERYSLREPSFNSRIDYVCGDLSLPRLGLSEERFQELARRIDVIYHNGALVNFVQPYSLLKTANVLGTREVLRLACTDRIKAVHYISTLSVLGEGISPDPLGFSEEDFPDPDSGLTDGYSQSKWVAEKLMRIARDRGLPVTLYRPSTVTGHSRTGVWNTDDFFCRLIKGCILAGKVPEEARPLDMVPVDYVSRAIVALSLKSASSGQTYHLNNPDSPSTSNLVDWMNRFGYSVEPVPYARWREEVCRAARDSPDHPLLPLLPLFEAEGEAEQGGASGSQAQRFDCRKTREALLRSGVVPPTVDRDLWFVYFSYFVKSGYLPAARTRGVNHGATE